MADRPTPELLERGDIVFLYRPKVHGEGEPEPEPRGINDVERFYIALKPEGAPRWRLVAIGRKRLPEIGGHERVWGFVETVEKAKAVEQELREQTYDTKTRGRRTRPAARPCGEGRYEIVRPDRSMHLAYQLELPEKPGPVQKALNIAPQASFVLSIKNPEAGAPANVGLREDDKPDYPKRLQQEFRGRRFEVEDPRPLDYPGTELVLVGARKDPEEAYAIDIDAEREQPENSEAVRDLGLVPSRHPQAPLTSGKWE